MIIIIIMKIYQNKIYNPTYYHESPLVHKRIFGHLQIFKNKLEFNWAFTLQEKYNGNFLNYCSYDTGTYGLTYWRGFRPLVKKKESADSNAKIVEAFQVVFDKNEF